MVDRILLPFHLLLQFRNRKLPVSVRRKHNRHITLHLGGTPRSPGVHPSHTASPFVTLLRQLIERLRRIGPSFIYFLNGCRQRFRTIIHVHQRFRGTMEMSNRIQCTTIIRHGNQVIASPLLCQIADNLPLTAVKRILTVIIPCMCLQILNDRTKPDRIRPQHILRSIIDTMSAGSKIRHYQRKRLPAKITFLQPVYIPLPDALRIHPVVFHILRILRITLSLRKNMYIGLSVSGRGH